MITYRNMTMADIPAGLSLCRSAGWNQLENDWEVFLSLSKYGNRVAVNDNGKVVGTVATITYEDHFSWIGMVLVDPGMKRQGVGTQLLRESLELLSNQETIKLDATPAGREVYLKLGFEDEYMLSRMMLSEKKISRNSFPGKKENFVEILDTDKKVFGASRKDLLQLYYNAFPEFCFIKNPSNYCFGRPGYNFTQIGPVVADDAEQAIELATAALGKIEGAVVLDVMENSAFSEWLASIGFVEQRKLIRMYRGKNNHPGIPAKQFAILGPEFG